MRILRYALRNIFRSFTLSVSSITVIALMSFLIFVLLLVEFVMQSLAQSVSSRLSLTLNTKTGLTATSSDIIDTLSAFRAIDPSIESTFSSAKDNLETLRKRDPELAKIVETDEENPLPSTIAVKNVPIEYYDELDRVIQTRSKSLELSEDTRKSFIGYKNQYDRLRKVVQVLHSLRTGLYGVIGFFLFSVFIVIFHSIGNAVFYFREEIKITELVGGQKRYIYGPFILQGMIYTAIALALSFGIFYFGLYSLDISIFFGTTMPLDQFFTQTSPLIFLVALSIILLGGVSGLLSSYKFVK